MKLDDAISIVESIENEMATIRIRLSRSRGNKKITSYVARTLNLIFACAKKIANSDLQEY